MIGESKGIGIPENSKERYGNNWKTILSDNEVDTSTVNAPFDPLEGFMVPEM